MDAHSLMTALDLANLKIEDNYESSLMALDVVNDVIQLFDQNYTSYHIISDKVFSWLHISGLNISFAAVDQTSFMNR